MSQAARDGYGINGESEDLKSNSQSAKDAVLEASRRTSDVAAGVYDSAKASTSSTVDAIKDQATQAAEEAKSTVAAIADEARAKFGKMVDDQKAAGADQVASMARAAQAAVGDLRESSPQLARFIENAAGQIETLADDIRASSINDIVGAMAAFGRRRPIAFFGGAVAVGFLFARFMKSDAPGAAPATDLRRT